MAVNGSFSGSSGNKYVQPTITWSAAQDIAGNYSDVTATLAYSRTNSGYTTYGTWNGGITINGVRTAGSKYVSITYNSNTVVLTATVRVYHNADGSKSITISADGGISGTSFNSTNCSSNVDLDPIPRAAKLTYAPDFDDSGEPPTILFTNPAGAAATVMVCISWTGADDIPYRTVTPGATSYTFHLTPEELESLYDATIAAKDNSISLRFYVTTIIGNNRFEDTLPRSFTLSDPLPEMNPTVLDQGSASYALTGNRTVLIRHFNYPKATFNAFAKFKAEITSAKVTCGSQTLYASGDYVQFNNVDSDTFEFTIVDSRNNEIRQTVKMEQMIDYVTLTCNQSYETELQPDNTIKIDLSVNGSYYNGGFGLVENSLAVEYRYKSSTTDYPVDAEGNEIWTAIPHTVLDGKYTASVCIENLDYQSTYTIQTRAKDAVYTWGVPAKDAVIKVVPVFDWGENDFNFNVPVHVKGAITNDIPVCSTDVDTMLTSGKYYMGTLAANKPGGKNGWLEVQASNTEGSYCYHRFIAYTGEKYERWRNAGVWGAWNRIYRLQEMGKSNGWMYEKYEGGVIKLHGYAERSVDITMQWGSVYRSGGLGFQLPFKLTSIHTVHFSVTGVQQAVWTGQNLAATSYDSVICDVFCGNSATGCYTYFNIEVVGTLL